MSIGIIPIDQDPDFNLKLILVKKGASILYGFFHGREIRIHRGSAIDDNGQVKMEQFLQLNFLCLLEFHRFLLFGGDIG